MTLLMTAEIQNFRKSNCETESTLNPLKSVSFKYFVWSHGYFYLRRRMLSNRDQMVM